jgi:hypothetical protein
MGTFFYGAGRLPIHVDDVVLAHLKAVATSKLRHSEGFLLSWTDSAEIGNGRNSVWIHQSCELHYRFNGDTPPKLDPSIINEMATQSHQPRGIELKDATHTFDPRHS